MLHPFKCNEDDSFFIFVTSTFNGTAIKLVVGMKKLDENSTTSSCADATILQGILQRSNWSDAV